MSAIAAAIAAPGIPGVVVCGAAGVGKSRIAREALSASSARGSPSISLNAVVWRFRSMAVPT